MPPSVEAERDESRMFHIELLPLVHEDLVADAQKIHSHRQILPDEDHEPERQAYAALELLGNAVARSSRRVERIWLAHRYNRMLRRYISKFRRQFEKNVPFVT